jgi:hypothetical protein
MQKFFDKLLAIISPWYVLTALGVVGFGLCAMMGSFMDIDFDRPGHRGDFFGVYGDAGDVLRSLRARYPNTYMRDDIDLQESSTRLFDLLCAGKFLNRMQLIVLTAFFVGYGGYSLDTGYKWLRKRQAAKAPYP